MQRLIKSVNESKLQQQPSCPQIAKYGMLMADMEGRVSYERNYDNAAILYSEQSNFVRFHDLN